MDNGGRPVDGQRTSTGAIAEIITAPESHMFVNRKASLTPTVSPSSTPAKRRRRPYATAPTRVRSDSAGGGAGLVGAYGWLSQFLCWPEDVCDGDG
jgi:hypothetical protein